VWVFPAPPAKKPHTIEHKAPRFLSPSKGCRRLDAQTA
jgi:hypothetical protein